MFDPVLNPDLARRQAQTNRLYALAEFLTVRPAMPMDHLGGPDRGSIANYKTAFDAACIAVAALAADTTKWAEESADD